MSEWVVASLLLLSALALLTGALGLLRLPDFFHRMHAPALAYTMASWLVTLASVVHFSVRGGGLSLHVWLIIIVLSITAPITTLLLSRAALFRRRLVGDPLPPPLGGGGALLSGLSVEGAAAQTGEAQDGA